jgi:Zn-dependent membrane protease YugP
MMLDPLYMLFIVPGLLLSLWASAKTRSAFAKYSQVVAETDFPFPFSPWMRRRPLA